MNFLRRLLGLNGPAAVLSTEERFNSGSALAASALSTFDQIIEDLIEANGHFTAVKDDTEARIERVKAGAEAEVARLSALAGEATSAFLQNSHVIGNVRRLTGSTV